ncbi:hypothetical protein ACFSC6_05415 [Rufibacter sediminis]|uniref:Glycosyltransferase RgtA/B/C/D-like domain-containing protein n=1 Tax=Rufibacter sediminis TaxID=2762756 RepID=A0ABR6VNC6_9BACT|nr:hypothetical protein [Rufibacter sediminis]MBC3538583.1 hypothetical protein [Rufibacter sediminis]
MGTKTKPILLFLAISLVILLRVAVEENGFTTPDSFHYMEAAKSIIEDGDLRYSLPGDQERYFSLWPAGYPFSIAIVSGLTSLPSLWSSKLVNLLWLSVAFWFFYRNHPQNAVWLGLAFCTNSLLDIFSYTWSEAGFTVALLWCSIALHRCIMNTEAKTLFKTITLVAAGLSMFLYRYVGGFIIGVVGAASILMLLKKKHRKAIQLIVAAASMALGMSLYFWFIYSQTGHYSGATRLNPDESFSYLLINLGQAQLNEFLLIRKIPFPVIDPVAVAFFLLQVLLMLYAFYQARKVQDWQTQLQPHTSDSLPLTIALVGMAYWLLVVGLRIFIMKFDTFDFRILSPASALCLIALHAYLAAEHRAPLLQRIQKPITALYLLALAHGLYKKQLLLLLNG